MSRAEIALGFVCFIWGSTFVVVKAALADVSPVLFLAIRFSAAAAMLGLLGTIRGSWSHARRGLGRGVLTGVFLYAGYLFQTLGLQQTTPATSGFITGLSVVIVPLLSAVVLARMPRWLEWAGIVLASSGMALMTLRTSSFAIGTGELLTLCCAFAFAAHILALSRFSPELDTDFLTFVQIASCAAIALLTFGWVEPVKLRWTNALVFAVVITSLLATAGAFWIQTWAQARTSPTRAALIFSLEPVFAWLTSWAVEGEVLTARATAGAACILAGILLVELRPTFGRVNS